MVKPRIVLMLFFTLPLVFSLSCKKIEGEFAFKKFLDNSYKRIDRALEFNSNEEIKWVFNIRKNGMRQDVAVIILKKEIGWVEVSNRIDFISMEKRNIHGVIKDFPPGEYRLMLIDVAKKNGLIDSCNFTVYFDEDEE